MHQSRALVVSVGVQTHVGRQRTENRDRVARAATPHGDLFVISDGSGGNESGSEAAQFTVAGFAEYLNSHPGMELEKALQEAAREINLGLMELDDSTAAARGSGVTSTAVLCVTQGNRVTYAHAGDSRAYLVRGGRLRQLTRDHSVAESLLTIGSLSPAEARQHPDAKMLTRTLGRSADTPLDIGRFELHPSDCLLLCSDGLWGYAPETEIEAVAGDADLSPSSVADALLNLALEGGGGDNISIQFLRFHLKAEKRGNARLR